MKEWGMELSGNELELEAALSVKEWGMELSGYEMELELEGALESMLAYLC
jgi:hypothetical protein